MNPEEQELEKFEQKLKLLVPAEPSQVLTSRIFAAFETPLEDAPASIGGDIIEMPVSKSTSSWSQPFAAAAAVALIAGIMALIGLSRPDGTPKVTTDNTKLAPPIGEAIDAQPVKFVPAGAQNIYKGTNVDGIVFTEDRLPMQAVRHQFIDTYIWENPVDGSRVEVQVPVERVRYIPVPTD
ncbi:MAG: hypothetical protein ACI8XO_001829 [Verrucomicrobiales bacterium]|jgi:hypothetical protein